METPLFTSIHEASRLLGVSRATLNRRMSEGSIKAHKIGRRVLIDMSSAIAWVQSLPVRKGEL